MRGGLQQIVKGLRPVLYLLKVASGEVRPRFKVGPLNEISNFVFGRFGVVEEGSSHVMGPYLLGAGLTELRTKPSRVRRDMHCL